MWGNCTSTTSYGRRAGLLSNAHIDEFTARGRISRSPNKRVNALLRDGCASDSAYAEVEQLGVAVAGNEKGVYLWLAPGSGAASVFARLRTMAAGGYGQQRLVLPYTDVARPVFLAIDKEATWDLHITPLDPSKPVRISEVRMARATDNVAALRKLRFSGSDTFVAANGDPRARVTVEMDDLFAPRWTTAEGFFANHDTCGSSFFIDATWEIDTGVQVQGRNIWINFALATNAEISAAIEDSVDYGETHFGPGFIYGGCTRAPNALIYQDWLGKAAAAQAGTYSGPQVYSDLCSAPSAGRAFSSYSAPITDDWRHPPANMIDDCTLRFSTWSGQSGRHIVLDAGQRRAMKGIYLWTAFDRAESMRIESSADGVNWSIEWLPHITSANSGLHYITLSDPNYRPRYIRLTAMGSSVNAWNNFTEVRWVYKNDTVVTSASSP